MVVNQLFFLGFRCFVIDKTQKLTLFQIFSTLKMVGQGRETAIVQMNIVVLIISMLLFLVLFFGIGFILNMLLRMTWIMAIIYPIVALFIVDEVRFIEYFTNTVPSLSDLGTRIVNLAIADILILACGWGGALVAGFTIKALRKKGYQMF